MKYESTILKRLIDTYGVVGNPRYISEIIKVFIVRGKERFPELFTYQADWLAHIDEFGLNPSYTVSYTGQSIYAPNTLERPVKRAILKGQTLINCVDNSKVTVADATKDNDIYTLNKSILYSRLNFNTDQSLLQINKTYTIILKDVVGSLENIYISGNGAVRESLSTGVAKVTIISEALQNRHLWIENRLATSGEVSFKVMIIEGDYTDVDIPYFTGIQSVKMPVLTTSNGDGTKTNILSTSEDVELRGVGDVKDELDCLTGEVTERIGEVVLNGSEDETYNTVVTSFNGSSNTIIEFVPSENLVVSLENDYTNAFLSNYNYKQQFDIDWITNSSNVWGIYLGVTDNKTTVRIMVADGTTDAEVRQHLQENPLRIVCKLATPTIKTVDLTIKDHNGQSVDHLKSFNGGTHVYTSSLDGSLVPSVDISVETDLEETLKMCSLDGNTM